MKFIFFISFLLASQSDYCQTGKQLHFNFRHIDHFDGLVSNTVSCISQDEKGFIWLGTSNGVQRYDGTWFRTYNEDVLGGERGISKIKKITGQGDEIYANYNFETHQYNQFQNKLFANPRDGAEFKSKLEIFTDENNKPWYLNNYGFYSFDQNLGKLISEFDLLTVCAGQSSNLVYDSANQQYWVYFKSNCFILDTKTKKAYSINDSIKNIFPEIIKKKLKVSSIINWLIDSDHNLWMSTWAGDLIRYNLVTKKSQDYSLHKIRSGRQNYIKSSGPMYVNKILEDNHKNVWLATYGCGLLLYNKKIEKFDYVTSDRNRINEIKYNFEILSLFQDKQGNIWVGTDEGISMFNPYSNLFKTISVGENKPLTLPSNEIETLYQTKSKKIIVGTWGGGTTFFDSTFHFEKNYNFSDDYRNQVWCFIEDNHGNIWSGCQYGFINRFSPRGSFLDFIRPAEADSSTIRCLAKDDRGNIFLGLQNGKIIKWDASQNKFDGYNFGKTVSFKQRPVTSLFIDSHKNIWAATWHGFYRFDPVKMIFVDSFFIDKNRKNSKNHNRPTCIQQLNDSTLILGYDVGGGSYFNLYSKKFTSWNLNADIASNAVAAVKKDEKGNVWFTADFGLYNFIPGNETNAVNFLTDGTEIHSPFHASTFIHLSNGQWATSTTTELLLFDPKELAEEKQKSFPVEITGFKIFEKPVFIDSFFQFSAPLQLSHQESSITIEFATLNYAPITDVQSFYQLEGLDKKWMNAGHNHFANYTNLSPGHYTFKVKSKNGNNESAVSRLSIDISSPFWQTIWFQLLVLACIAFIVYALVLRRIKTVRKESTLKQKISETEMAALRAQMNPHFIFNCINAIDNLIQNGEKDNATTYLAMFARLIRNVLESSKNNIIPFQRDLESIKLFIELEQFRCSNKFSYTIDTDQDLLNGDYKVPPLIIQPFIENAIHHGLLNKESGSCQLNISMFLKEEYIHYTITDNGVGRQRSHQLKVLNKPEHISYGIAISTERLDRYNGETESIQITDLYENNKPAGTKVEINIKADESKSNL